MAPFPKHGVPNNFQRIIVAVLNHIAISQARRHECLNVLNINFQAL